MPVGKARIARAGRDLTIVAYSAMVQEAWRRQRNWPGRALRSKWWICARQAFGYRYRYGFRGADGAVAVRRRIVAVGGVTAEVIARVATEGFDLLDAPPQRLNAKDTPIPSHPNFWSAHRPTAHSILTAARNFCECKHEADSHYHAAIGRVHCRSHHHFIFWSRPATRWSRSGRHRSRDQQGDDERSAPGGGTIPKTYGQIERELSSGRDLGVCGNFRGGSVGLGLDDPEPEEVHRIRNGSADANRDAERNAKSYRWFADCPFPPTRPGRAICPRA